MQRSGFYYTGALLTAPIHSDSSANTQVQFSFRQWTLLVNNKRFVIVSNHISQLRPAEARFSRFRRSLGDRSVNAPLVQHLRTKTICDRVCIEIWKILADPICKMQVKCASISYRRDLGRNQLIIIAVDCDSFFLQERIAISEIENASIVPNFTQIIQIDD